MVNGGKTWRAKLSRWLDEWKLAGSGILLATRNRQFLIAAALTFVVFGTLMDLLSSSTAKLTLFWYDDLAGKLKILGDGFLGLFGANHSFFDWLLLFSMTLLQSVLIGLVVLVWRKRRRNKAERIVATATNADNIQNAGLAAGLAVLGTGCPTCGTTLLAPVIGAFFSTGSYALAGTISGLLTAAAVIIALLTVKHLGNDAYAMIVSERYQKRHQKNQEGEKS